MAPDTVDYSKGESPMTDEQFKAYVELRDKYEALLELRVKPQNMTDDAGSDYQFRRYEQLRDEHEEFRNEIALLKKENAGLRMQLEMFRNSSRRFRL